MEGSASRKLAEKALREFVEHSPGLNEVRYTNERILQEYSELLARGDRIAYSNWPKTNTSFELAALLHLIDVHYCGRNECTSTWNERGPLRVALDNLGLEYRVELSRLAPNVAGSTSWGKEQILVEMNSTLNPYLQAPSTNFYAWGQDPIDCSGCKQKHSTTNVLERRSLCPFRDPALRVNHVGNINCTRVGCLLETLLHEYCHAIEFSYRCVTRDVHQWGSHHPHDDHNKLFLHIRSKFTDHSSSFNNLLHSRMS